MSILFLRHTIVGTVHHVRALASSLRAIKNEFPVIYHARRVLPRADYSHFSAPHLDESRAIPIS